MFLSHRAFDIVIFYFKLLVLIIFSIKLYTKTFETFINYKFGHRKHIIVGQETNLFLKEIGYLNKNVIISVQL